MDEFFNYFDSGKQGTRCNTCVGLCKQAGGIHAGWFSYSNQNVLIYRQALPAGFLPVLQLLKTQKPFWDKLKNWTQIALTTGPQYIQELYAPSRDSLPEKIPMSQNLWKYMGQAKHIINCVIM